jgi:phthiocerol/phenolphthiocerol synthesis type-I polyketide synthase E
MQAIVADNASRDILLTDIFTAFAQRLAGQDIALQPATTPWPEWSQRCAALATHPAVVESRDFWLKTAANATLRVTNSEVSEPPRVEDL